MYSEKEKKELKKAICKRLAKGDSLVKICYEKQMPSYSSVMVWLDKDEDFLESYLRARKCQADQIFDECLDIIDVATPEDIQVRKERVNTRMRMAGKLWPKKYGEKVDLNHGNQGGKPFEINIVRGLGDNASDNASQ